MSETSAKYSFLSHVRRGLGNEITEIDFLGNPSNNNNTLDRPEVDLKVKIEASGGSDDRTENVEKTVKIQGPGDVLGIQPNQILRVHPAKGVDNFECTDLVYIEFYEEDFPWRFTPAKPFGNHLRPWLALLVLENHEFERNTDGGTPTPFIIINNDALQDVLYPENELHHFAHVHSFQTLSDDISNSSSDATSELGDVVAANPDLAISRLICPRRLQADTEYHVFLVPAYETGRLAGLKKPTQDVVAQKPSWKSSQPGNSSLEMPYYYNWSFQTGSTGSFKELVLALKVKQIRGKSGREMDLSDPGYGLKPKGNDATGLIEGAIKSTNHVTPNWPEDEQDLKEKLKDLLNLNQRLQTEPPETEEPHRGFYSDNPGDDPIITPPVYGRWHAMVDTLTNQTDWVHQLNLHPSHRAAAGLGTRVVQEHQEKFMEMAWNQIGPIIEDNRKIIMNEAAMRAAEIVWSKHMEKMDSFMLINALGKAMDVIKVGDITAKKQLFDSRVPTGVASGAFVKIANNFTQTALMTPNGMDGAKEVLNGSLLTRLNGHEDSISINPPRGKFDIEVGLDTFLQYLDSIYESSTVSTLGSLSNALAHAFESSQAQSGKFSFESIPGSLIFNFPASTINTLKTIVDNIVEINLDKGILNITISVDVYRSHINTYFDAFEFGVSGLEEKGISTVRLQMGGNLVKVFNYEEFASLHIDTKIVSQEMADRVFAPQTELKLELRLDYLRTRLLNSIRPINTFYDKLDLNTTNADANKGKPLMAYPRFPIPVYDYLKEISPDYIIPNISDIAPNSIVIMEPNNAFVEAFLVGMNHEFSRELLWREFPTDMRGSYFRHFWEFDNDPTNNMLPQEGETEAQFKLNVIEFQNKAVDVEELHKWEKNLGENHNNERKIGLLLLIKGELFKKYPDTMVYAQRAEEADSDDKPRELSDFNNPNNVKWPIITGMIEPDLYFFGFNLTPNEAKGNPGWYFVISERPGQITFGLNPNDDELTNPETWDELTWNHLSEDGSIPGYLKIDSLPQDSYPNKDSGVFWGSSSAATAYILYKSPVRFAKHASVFLQ